MTKRVHIFIYTFLLLFHLLEAKLPDINARVVKSKFDEMLKFHASEHQYNDKLAERTLNNYLELLDPTKTYFLYEDIKQWSEPSAETLEKVRLDIQKMDYSIFSAIYDKMIQAIERRKRLEKKIDFAHLPTRVKSSQFKDMKWATNEEELLKRLTDIKAMQVEISQKLKGELQELSLQRIEKRRAKYEEELMTKDAREREKEILTKVLKALASSLDTHTSYFTPDEAEQFIIDVQQRLFGIGAQLRDDLNGFTIIKIVEGGPAAREGTLKTKDRIVAVNGEPIVGMDIIDAVSLIRGEEGSSVTLTILRPVEGSDESTLNVTIKRGAVVVTESRYESAIEPFGKGVIAYLGLHSFYQDEGSSSAKDLANAFHKIAKDHKILGVVLDLRYNSGGFLSQAVAVSGLFIKKGVVVSVKDDTGSIQRLRNIDETSLWDGPLVVLINRSSASASEIVAQSLQDYGRAIIIGDDYSFGKGSFQTFTLNANGSSVNPQGEYKLTRGRYYTVSGKSPQFVGVSSDILVPGPLSQTEIGERFRKYSLPTDQIPDSFHDDLSDIPAYQRDKVLLLYGLDMQKKIDSYTRFLDPLKKNSALRIQNNKGYQTFLKEIKKLSEDDIEGDEESIEHHDLGQSDPQLTEAYNILKDLILFYTAHD